MKTNKKMKQKNLIAIMVMAIIVLIGGCATDDFQETLGVCPIVIATSPTNGQLNVPLNQIITVTFNEEMNPETIDLESFTIIGTSALSGIISYSGDTATFTPNANLTPNTTYVGTVTTAVKDLNGNALQENYTWSFTTGATLQPRVLATSPTSNETNVVLNKVIKATFNMPMNPASINNVTFTLKQGTNNIQGVVTYVGKNAYFNPNNNLSPNLVYTATITTGAENTATIAIASNYVWSFTTGTIIAPKVIATDPLNNENGVALDKTITATFDMAMNPLTINDLSFTLVDSTIKCEFLIIV
jgi:hypothetical protein